MDNGKQKLDPPVGRGVWWALGTALVVTGTAWAGVLAVDVLDVGGVRERLFVAREADMPHLYIHLADNNRPLEWVQWILLIVGSVTSGLASGRWLERGERDRAMRVGGLAILLGLLAIKDAGSPRHVIRAYVLDWFGETAMYLAELTVFGVVAAVALVVFVRLLPLARLDRPTGRLLIIGYSTYAVAALMSATRTFWYQDTGLWIQRNVFRDRMLQAFYEEGQGYMFMDSIVEESVELLAIGLLVALSFRLLEVSRGHRLSLDSPATAGSPHSRPSRSP